MIDEIRAQLDRIRRLGATYVDCRWYPYEESNALTMWNGNLKQAAASRESGVGIRVLTGGAWGFSAASDISDLGAVFDRALENARVAADTPCGEGCC
jgi:predicted Zn-dependent protease